MGNDTLQDRDFKVAKPLKYQVRNWREYNLSLIARGSLLLWIDDAVIRDWYAQAEPNHTGFQKIYSDTCIQSALQLKFMYKLTLRAVQGLLESLFDLLNLDIQVPSYSTLCRRQRQLKTHIYKPHMSQENIVLAIDSTGLKVFGEGEWKTRMHGYDYRRVWRKLHLAIDVSTQAIEAVVLSTNDFKDGELLEDLLDQIEVSIKKVLADGAYESFANYESVAAREAVPVIPPRRGAKVSCSDADNPTRMRDSVVGDIQAIGLKQWKQQRGYYLRNLVETTMYRFKQLFGDTLSARSFESQLVEAIEKCSMLNLLTRLGMPDGRMA